MKLHLGCGMRYIEGFKHVDIIPADHIDVTTSIDDLSMIGTNEVELIYACHVLEHFKRRALTRVLKEWIRVLRPGGTLRLAVPDFEAMSKLYVAGTATLDELQGPLVGGQTYLYNFHYSIFDFTMLRCELEAAGFVNARRYDWKATEHADVDDFSQAYLPHMDKANGTLISLNVEADKAQP